MDRYSKVTIRGEQQSKIVKIGSSLKPDIEKAIIEKWQSIIDTGARLVDVPSGLIMRLKEQTIEVFLSSKTTNNPYKAGEQAELVYGLYCETVIGKQQKLLVSDATKNEVWKDDNPDVEINMISYLGYPLNWPDGEVFGTVCLLDNKENQYSRDFEDLLYQIKIHIENDLKLLVKNSELETKKEELEKANIIKSRFLSLISHDIRGSLGAINELILYVIKDLDQYNKESLITVLHTIGAGTTTLYETLEDLLRWSRGEIVNLHPETKDVNLIGLIDNILSLHSQNIKLKGIHVIKSYCSEQVIVNTDENMLSVAVRNLISNAIKFSHKNGELKIIVNKGGSGYVITIEDNGTGMSEEIVEGLFSYSGKQVPGTHNESSAGIGLMLTKEFLDKLNARISVKSQPGKGTAFTIEMD